MNFTIEELNTYIEKEGLDIKKAKNFFLKYTKMSIPEILKQEGLKKRNKIIASLNDIGINNSNQTFTHPNYVSFNKSNKLDPEENENIIRDSYILQKAKETL